MEKQSFNLNADFLGEYTGVFIKLVIAIIIIYGFILVINLLRDKFVKKDSISKDPHITDLLSILNKLFYLAGFGFVLGNIMQVILNLMTRNLRNSPAMNFRGDWDYLTFGIILIFIGISFKVAKKAILKDREE